MTTRNILALDPATRTGWAFASGDDVETGVWQLGDERDALGYKLDRLLGLMTAKCKEHGGVDVVAIEDAALGSRFGSTKAWHNKLHGIIEVVAYRLSAGMVRYAPTTIKSYATDDGRATKQQMMRACETLFGLRALDDNEADARFVLEMARLKIPGTQKKPRKPRMKKRPGKKPKGNLF